MSKDDLRQKIGMVNMVLKMWLVYQTAEQDRKMEEIVINTSNLDLNESSVMEWLNSELNEIVIDGKMIRKNKWDLEIKDGSHIATKYNLVQVYL